MTHFDADPAAASILDYEENAALETVWQRRAGTGVDVTEPINVGGPLPQQLTVFSMGSLPPVFSRLEALEDAARWIDWIIRRGPRKGTEVQKNPETGALRDIPSEPEATTPYTTTQPYQPPRLPDPPSEPPVATLEPASVLQGLTQDRLDGATFEGFRTTTLHGGDHPELDAPEASAFGKVTIDGVPYFFKALEPELLEKEVVMARLAEVAGISHLDARIATVPASGYSSPALLTEWADDTPLGKWLYPPNSTDPAVLDYTVRVTRLLSEMAPGELDRHLLFCFLTAAWDRNQGNYLIRGDHFVSIDHERVFTAPYEAEPATPHEAWMGAITWNTLADLHDRYLNKPLVFSGAVIREMIEKATHMADLCEQFGRPEWARGIRERQGILKSLDSSRPVANYELRQATIDHVERHSHGS